MRGRSADEEHRVSTSLELFFDLCFVVAVSQAAAQLAHRLAEGHYGSGLLGFTTVFFAIWWAWLNFTWFASAYDTDDVPYRVMTLVQMSGVLVLAAGVPRAFHQDFAVVVVGYVIMRVAQVGQWLRAAHEHPEGRSSALVYGIGIFVVQVGWVLRLGLHGASGAVSWTVLALADMSVPIWAEWRRRTSWHPGHIAERYGLFTLIVLGESVLAATDAVQAGLDVRVTEVLKVAIGGLLVVFAMWWIYFAQPAEEMLTRASATGDYRPSFLWGYGHYLIFASAAAVGAGLEVAVEQTVDRAHLSATAAGMTVAVPVAIYVLSVWLIHARRGMLGFPVAAVAVVVAPVTGHAVPLIGLIMAGLVAVTVVWPSGTPIRGW